jgi:hypothetical protein
VKKNYLTKFPEIGFGEFTSLNTNHMPYMLYNGGEKLTRSQMAKESRPNELMKSETSGGHI